MKFLGHYSWHQVLGYAAILGSLVATVSCEVQTLNPSQTNVQPRGGSYVLESPGDSISYQVSQAGRTLPWAKFIVTANTDAPAWNITINGATQLISAGALSGGFEAAIGGGTNTLQITFPTDGGVAPENSLEISLVRVSTDAVGVAPAITTTSALTSTTSLSTSTSVTSRSLSLPTTTITTDDGELTTDDPLSRTLRPPPASTYDPKPTGAANSGGSNSGGGKIAGAILGTLFGVAALFVAVWYIRRNKRRSSSTAFRPNYADEPDPPFRTSMGYYGSGGDNSGAVAASPVYAHRQSKPLTASGPNMSPVMEERIQDPFQNPIMGDGPYPLFPSNPVNSNWAGVGAGNRVSGMAGIGANGGSSKPTLPTPPERALPPAPMVPGPAPPAPSAPAPAPEFSRDVNGVV